MHSYDAVFLPQTQTHLIRTLQSLSVQQTISIISTRIITQTIATSLPSVTTVSVCRDSVLALQS
jgi:hypothetical protein